MRLNITGIFWLWFFAVILCLLIVIAGIMYLKATRINSYEKWKVERLKLFSKIYRWSVPSEYLKLIENDDEVIKEQNENGYYFRLR